jgi:hypothetical protein
VGVLEYKKHLLKFLNLDSRFVDTTISETPIKISLLLLTLGFISPPVCWRGIPSY